MTTTIVINKRWPNLLREKLVEERTITYIGRPTPFGNPHHITRYFTREQAIEAYRETFAIRMDQDQIFRKEVEKLRGHALECWCSPLPCHGDVIAEYLNKLESRGNVQ